MRTGQIVQFPLARGLAEDDNPKAKPTASLKSGVNIRWPRAGVIGKRYGSGLLPTPPATVRRFITRDRELAFTDGNRIYSYDPTAGVWRTGPLVSDVSLEWSTVVDSIAGARACDAVILSNGQIVEAWVSGDPLEAATGDLYYQIRDLASGAFVKAPTFVDNFVSGKFRLVASGTTWYAVYGDLGDGQVRAWTTGAGTVLASGSESSAGFSMDACVIGTDLVIAYTPAAGGIQLKRFSMATLTEAASEAVSGESSTAIQSISIAGGSGESLYVTYFDGTSTAIRRAIANPSTLAQTVAPGNVDTSTFMVQGTVAAVRLSATSCLLLYSYMSSDVDMGIMKTVTISSAGTVSTGQATPFLRPLSRPFAVGSRWYAFAATDILASSFDGDAQLSTNDSFLVDVTHDGLSHAPFRQVGKLDVFIAGTWFRGYVCTPTALSATRVYAPMAFQSTPVPGRVGWRQGVRLVRVASGADVVPDMWQSVQLQGEANIAAGMLTSYDGIDALGYGWPHGPFMDADNMLPSNGGSMAAGDYLYNVTAERRSGVGVMHRAPFGVPISATVGANGNISVGIVPASLGRSATIPGHYPLYRSEANGSVLYRLTVEPSFMTKTDIESGFTVPITIEDDSASNAIGINNQMDLLERPQPYTASGELEDVQPPAPWTVHLHNGRLGIVTGSRREYWYSKAVGENPGIAPGFNPVQVELYDQNLVACATLDDKRIMLAERALWYVVGDGPTVAGTDNRFSPPIPIQADVGCTNPRSVVTWPGGLIFQSGNELHNLSRALEVTWISRDAKDILASYPNITSAVLVADQNEIRWTCNDEGGTTGVILVYDYQRNTWSSRTYPSTPPMSDAVLHDGVYYFAAANAAQIRYEDTSTHLDSGSYASSTIELADIAPAGPVGWQRVRLVKPLGQSLSNHALSVAVSRDWATSYEQTESFAAGSAVTTPGVHMRAEVALTVSRRQAVGVKFTDAAPANTTTHPLGNGAGFELEGVALLVQPMPGMPRDTSTRRGG